MLDFHSQATANLSRDSAPEMISCTNPVSSLISIGNKYCNNSAVVVPTSTNKLTFQNKVKILRQYHNINDLPL
jgi:hypothetical protein